MEIKTQKISTIIPYAANPRSIPEEAVKAVAASIAAYGFNQPIVIDEKNCVIVGHTRLQAATLLGYDCVPVMVVSHLTEAQKKAYRIVDNKTGEKSSWEYNLLQLELQDLDLAEDALSLSFTQDELDVIMQADFNPRQQSNTETTNDDQNTRFCLKLDEEEHMYFVEAKSAIITDNELTDGQALVVICKKFISKDV